MQASAYCRGVTIIDKYIGTKDSTNIEGISDCSAWALDFSGVEKRRRSRSKYGVKQLECPFLRPTTSWQKASLGPASKFSTTPARPCFLWDYNWTIVAFQDNGPSGKGWNVKYKHF
jgi:hypothetical protein